MDARKCAKQQYCAHYDFDVCCVGCERDRAHI